MTTVRATSATLSDLSDSQEMERSHSAGESFSFGAYKVENTRPRIALLSVLRLPCSMACLELFKKLSQAENGALFSPNFVFHALQGARAPAGHLIPSALSSKARERRKGRKHDGEA